MRFYYLAEGKEIGSMTIQDFWFERRYIREDGKNNNVMVTIYTAKQDLDPYNGSGIVQLQQGEEYDDMDSASSAAA
eukprot:2510814-Amphidinium_carterae.2